MERSRPVILQGMEPGLANRGPGRIIFLNGASSSGTSTLAKAMQQASGEPFPRVVGAHCDLAEIGRRERDRGDRRIGEGRARRGVPAVRPSEESGR